MTQSPHQLKSINDDQPRSLRDAAEIERRRELLRLPHMVPLVAYVQNLRERNLGEVPDFDALDGGVAARILFLFEKPGPMTSMDGTRKRIGSGFISRNNDDPTAEATFKFMKQARIPRSETILWNTVPAWNGTRKITRTELNAGLSCLDELIRLLPELQAVVLVGKQAERVRPQLSRCPIAVFTSPHPSPLVKARWPERWMSIGSEWSKAAVAIGCL